MLAICKGLVNLGTQSPGLALSTSTSALVHYRYGGHVMALAMVTVLVLLVIFYRDPPIKTGFPDNVVMGPCYGRVKKIMRDANLYRIIIFLSPLDVHTQTMPVNGFVADATYDATGKFDLAYKVDKSRFNEKMTTTIVNPELGPVKVRQIAGKMVRRISNPNKKGKDVKCGEKLGMIKFGSRVDIEVFAPGLVIDVKEGQYVHGSDTMIAHRLPMEVARSWPFTTHTATP